MVSSVVPGSVPKMLGLRSPSRVSVSRVAVMRTVSPVATMSRSRRPSSKPMKKPGVATPTRVYREVPSGSRSIWNELRLGHMAILPA